MIMKQLVTVSNKKSADAWFMGHSSVGGRTSDMVEICPRNGLAFGAKNGSIGSNGVKCHIQ